METNGKVLMFVHVLHGNNEDLFICESNAIKTQYTCLDTEQNTCRFERNPNETREIVLPYSGEGCVCIRTSCNFILLADITVDTSYHSIIGACNFTNTMGCDSNYSVPVTSCQLLRSNYTLIQDLPPGPVGMNLASVKKLLQHDNLYQLLECIQDNAQKNTLILLADTILLTDDTEEIHHVLERVQKDGEQHCWETLLRWPPTARGAFTSVLHPVVILLILTLMCLLLVITLYVEVWQMLRRLAHLVLPKESESCPRY